MKRQCEIIRTEALAALERIRTTQEATGELNPVVRSLSEAKAPKAEGRTRKRRMR